LVATALCGLGAALVLPYLPLAPILGFARPPAAVLGAVAALVLVYLVAAELFKNVALPK
jgi:Mg2+-importing ATPase